MYEFQQKIRLSYIMVHAKQNLNLVPRAKYIRERGIEVDLSKYTWQLINQSKKLQLTFESTYVYNTLQMRHKTLWDICPTEKYVIAPDYQEQ